MHLRNRVVCGRWQCCGPAVLLVVGSVLALAVYQVKGAQPQASHHLHGDYNGDIFNQPGWEQHYHDYGHEDAHAGHEDAHAGSEGQHMASKGPGKAPSTDQDATPERVPVLTIMFMTLIMSSMAGFGAVPFFIVGKLKDSWAGLANAVACGVMLTASFDLLNEGAPYSPTLVIVGMLMGAIFIKSSQEFLNKYEDVSFEDLQGADARKAMLIVGVMAAHAFGEGSGVGVSFSGNRGWAQGTLVTIAIGLHNIPEGMAVATVMMSKGATPRKALFWSLFCAFPQALVAVPSYMFVETFSALLPLALGFAAGCMIWMVFAELIPDALAAAPHPQVATAATFSAAWLQGLSMLIATLEQPNGKLASPIKGDVPTVLARLLLLAPAILVPCLVAPAANSLLPSLPVTLGAAVGISAALGLLGLISQLTSAPLGVLSTLAWTGIGAGSAVMLWSTTKGGQTEESKQEECSIEAPPCNGTPAWMTPAPQHTSHVAGLPTQHALNGLDPHQPSGHVLGMPGMPAGHHQNGNCHCKDGMCDGRHYMAEPNGNGHADVAWNPKSGVLGGGQWHNLMVAAYGILALVLYGGALGLELARAVANNLSGCAHLLLPLALKGAPLGLACVGLGKLFSGAGLQPTLAIATAISSTTLVIGAGALLAVPVGNVEAGGLQYDSGHLTDKAMAFAHGVLLVISLVYMMPVAMKSKPQKAQAGLLLGAGVAAAAWCLHGALCWGTPYCMAAAVSHT